MALFSDNEFESITHFAGLLSEVRNVVITCHLSPDGDAMGSSLALARILANMGIKSRVVTPDEPNRNLQVLPGFENVLSFSRNQIAVERFLKEADMVICLDFNGLSRLSRLESAVAAVKCPRILIDHHLYPEKDSFAISISKPERSSTCSLLYSVLSAANLSQYIDTEAATCILGGMMTDTNNFSHNANHPEDYLIVSDLVERGADKNSLYNKLFNTFSANCLKLNGYAISKKMKVYPQYHAAMITLSRDELNYYHYSKGDTEGLVNKPLSIPGVIFSCYLREESEYIKVSMRSTGDFPVDIVCSESFGGGGHKNASGGEFHGTMEEAVSLFESLLPELNKRFINNQQ